MYDVSKNNFYKNEKNSTIFTPDEISLQIFKIMQKEIPKDGLIFDPCVGQGSLLKPWQNFGWEIIGYDIKDQGFSKTGVHDYLSLKKDDIKFKPDFVVINPPFNFTSSMLNSSKEMGFGSRPLIPELFLAKTIELFLAKTIELFGKKQKIALFTPYGLRLNNNSNSKRLIKFINGDYPEITSIASLPKDVYENVTFHSEILFFNTKKTKPHYFLFKKGEK